jgi:hypothetical protein
MKTSDLRYIIFMIISCKNSGPISYYFVTVILRFLSYVTWCLSLSEEHRLFENRVERREGEVNRR